MSNPNFDSIASTTLDNYGSKFEDNIFSARPLAFFLKDSNSVVVGGGKKIVRQLAYALNSTFQSYEYYDTLPTTPQDEFTSAEFDWGEAAVSIAISGREEAMNSSEEEIIDLLEGKITVAEETATEKFDQMWLSDGTGNSGKDWNGLKNLVAQNSTSVGGIDPTSATWWQSKIDTTSETLSISKINTQYNNQSVGNDHPTIGLTTQTLYEKFESLLQPQARYTDMKVADAGFENLKHKAATVCYDANVDSGYWYFLNPKYLKLVRHRDVWFKRTPFVKPENQNAKFCQILFMGQLIVTNRARQGVMTNKSA